MTQAVYIYIVETPFYNKKFDDTDIVQSTNYLPTKKWIIGGTFFTDTLYIIQYWFFL